MTEKGKLFLEKLSKDAKLKAELAEIIKDACLEKTIAFAKANGFDIEKADIRADKEELDPEELEMVTGGTGPEIVICKCPGFGIVNVGPDSRSDNCCCSGLGIGTIFPEYKPITLL